MFKKLIQQFFHSRRLKSIEKDRVAFLNAQPILHDDLPYLNVADREDLMRKKSNYAGIINSFNPLRFFDHAQKSGWLGQERRH